MTSLIESSHVISLHKQYFCLKITEFRVSCVSYFAMSFISPPYESWQPRTHIKCIIYLRCSSLGSCKQIFWKQSGPDSSEFHGVSCWRWRWFYVFRFWHTYLLWNGRNDASMSDSLFLQLLGKTLLEISFDLLWQGDNDGRSPLSPQF